MFGQAEVHEDDSLRAVRAAVELRDAVVALERDRGSARREARRRVGRGLRRRRRAPRGSRRATRSTSRPACEGGGAGARSCSATSIHRLVRGAVQAERLEPGTHGVAAARAGARGLGDRPRRPRARSWDGSASWSALRGRLRPRPGRARLPRGDRRRSRRHRQVAARARAHRRLGGRRHGRRSAAARPTARGSPTVRWPRSSASSAEPTRGSGSASCSTATRRPRRWCSAAIGLSDGPAQAEETFWAVRRMFERVAQERPLVVVVEDVHWAEPTLLDLLEYLVAFVERARRPARLPRAARAAGDAARMGRAAAEPVAAGAGRALGRGGAPARRARRRGSARARRRGSWSWPRATRCSSSTSWLSEPRPARPRCRRASRRCSPRASTASNRVSARCSSTPRSRGGASMSARVEELLPEGAAPGSPRTRRARPASS